MCLKGGNRLDHFECSIAVGTTLNSCFNCRNSLNALCMDVSWVYSLRSSNKTFLSLSLSLSSNYLSVPSMSAYLHLGTELCVPLSYFQTRLLTLVLHAISNRKDIYSRLINSQQELRSHTGSSSMFSDILNLFKTKRYLLYIKNQAVPRSKHFPPRL